MAAFDGKVNKLGDWEGLYNEVNKLLQVKYYDFDRIIRQKTVMSHARPRSASVLVYDEYKAAFAFRDKYNKGLHQRSRPHKHGGNYHPRNLGHRLCVVLYA